MGGLKQKRIIIVTIICLLVLTAAFFTRIEFASVTLKPQGVLPETSGELTQAQKLEDFEYMYRILQKNYPFFGVNKRVYGIDWLANKEEYKTRVASTKNNFEFFACMNGILAELNNGHSNLLSKEDYDMFYCAYKDMENDSKPWAKLLQQPEVMKRYGLSKEAGASMLRDLKSNTNSEGIFADNLRTDTIVPGKVAYIGIKSLSSLKMEKDGEKLHEYFKSIKNYSYLVLDIRGNGGGSESYWMEYIIPRLIDEELKVSYYFLFRGDKFGKEYIKYRFPLHQLKPVAEAEAGLIDKFPPEVKSTFKYMVQQERCIKPQNPVGFKGKIYLLVDGSVYSSSEALAIYCKQSGFAKLVGKRTGGDGIGIDPALFALPNSHYVGRLPLVLGLTQDGKANDEVKTMPDIWVEDASIRAFDEDACIQAVLKDIGYKK